jgi:peptide/nickel transport system ATP-binding protein
MGALSVVQHVSDRVTVMYLDRIVEEGLPDVALGTPKDLYTQTPISSISESDPTKRRSHALLPGDPPNSENIPEGGAFHPLRPIAQGICRSEVPAFKSAGASRARCDFAGDL